MKVQIDKRLTEQKLLLDLVNAATAILEEEIGPSSARVAADWSLEADDRGRPLVRLSISDFAGRASSSLTPDELRASDGLRRRFYRLWGDLLQEESRRQIKVLEALEAE
ncbi:MAG: hypothetical protein U0793_29905 [Gemmataceae bacterium]